MKTKILAVIVWLAFIAMMILLAGCTIEPLIYTDAKGREVASLGSSLLTKATQRDLTIRKADGTTIESRTTGKDETKAASVIGNQTLMNKAAPIASGAGSYLTKQ